MVPNSRRCPSICCPLLISTLSPTHRLAHQSPLPSHQQSPEHCGPAHPVWPYKKNEGCSAICYSSWRLLFSPFSRLRLLAITLGFPLSLLPFALPFSPWLYHFTLLIHFNFAFALTIKTKQKKPLPGHFSPLWPLVPFRCLCSAFH
ncbi:hypothetical protein niasHT_029066 [Heterodera trifolii]|uniref:Uncharacterized protein n=1 Tax=Heterodera trifolii TaxID=157864 RepID=A0ABD2KRR7_9BILA